MRENSELKSKKSIDIYDLSVALTIISCLSFAYMETGYIISQVVLFIITTIIVFKNKKINLNLFIFIIWGLLVTSYMIASNLWADNRNVTINGTIMSYVQVLLISGCMIYYMNSIDRVNKVIKYYILAGCIIIVRFFVEIPISSWGVKERFANGTLFGSNETAMVLSYGAIIAWILYSNTKNMTKILCYSFMAVSIFITIMMGTKGGIISFAIGLIVYACLKTENIFLLLRRFIMIGAVLAFIYYMLMNNEILYNSLGYRIDYLIAALSGNGVTDASTSMRFSFAQYGLEVFFSNPIIGIGQDGFRYVNIYEFTYAHDNYVEMLANLGSFGFLLYYSFFIYMAKCAITMRKYSMLPLTLVIVILCMEFVGVTYSTENVYILISIVYSMSHILKKDVVE